MTGQQDIAALVPHKGKMLLIDTIISVDREGKSMVSQVRVGCDDTFFDRELGGVPAYVSFEYMAQSISALSALTGTREEPRPGVILSVSNLSCTHGVFQEGAEVRIHVREDCRVGDLLTYDCAALVGEETVVSCTLMVMEAESLEKLSAQKEEN